MQIFWNIKSEKVIQLSGDIAPYFLSSLVEVKLTNKDCILFKVYSLMFDTHCEKIMTVKLISTLITSHKH